MSASITFGSVCSGIEAASVAWNPLGWRAAWLAEIEPFPCAVLAHHYPDVPNLGDMTKIAPMIRDGFVPAPDVFCGGTPCQAFSVAGLRNSLDDARGNLSLTFCEIANEIDARRAAAGFLPSVIVWENVPGVLSTKDNAFGCFLAGLAGEDDPLIPPGGKWTNAGCVFGPERTVAWRVLDAQYFGVAQRRKRVFVVASARKGFDPLAILLESDSMRRDSAPSRKAGQDVAGTLASRTGGGGFPGSDESCSGYVQAVEVCPTLRAGGNKTGGDRPPGTDVDTADSLIAYSVALRGRDGGGTAEMGGDLATCLRASTGGGDKPHVLAPTSYAIQAGALRTNPNSGPDGVGVQSDVAYTLEARAEVQCAQIGMAVRRLTPRECERLQGFDDFYTLIPVKKVRRERLNSPKKNNEDIPRYREINGEVWQLASDGPRYKALGNSWAIPNVRWIGARIDRELKQGRADSLAAI